MWKSACEKEEKKSIDRWRYKEIWQLDYVRKYGKTVIKENTSKWKTKNRNPVRNNEQVTNYAAATRRNTSLNTEGNNRNCNTEIKRTGPKTNKHQKQSEQNPYHPRPTTNSNIQQKTNRGYQRETRNRRGHNYLRNSETTNVFKTNGTTYIGRGTRQYFLGGGKLNGSQRFENTRQRSWIQK